MKQQIISIGGGGFSRSGVYSADDVKLSRYFLNQTGKEIPSICFIPTASADAAAYIVNFYDEFIKLPCKPSHLSLFSPPVKDIESFLLSQDVIYVGGGSTKNLLALWKEWGIDRFLQKALQKGIILGGVSAGMNCWYEECVTDSLFGDLTALKCLGFLKGSGCPHYNGEKNRRPAYQALMQEQKVSSGIAIEDNAAVHYVDGKIKTVVTTKQTSAYQVSIENGRIIEHRLDALVL